MKDFDEVNYVLLVPPVDDMKPEPIEVKVKKTVIEYIIPTILYAFLIICLIAIFSAMVQAEPPCNIEGVWLEKEAVMRGRIDRKQRLPVVRTETKNNKIAVYSFKNRDTKNDFIRRLEHYEELKYAGKDIPLLRRQR